MEVQVLSSACRVKGARVAGALRIACFLRRGAVYPAQPRYPRRRGVAATRALLCRERLDAVRKESVLFITNTCSDTPPRRHPMLTARQQEIWQFLVEYTDGHGYPPTVREIGEAVGLASPSTVHAHLANLERAGLLKRDPIEAAGARPDRPPQLEAVAASGARIERRAAAAAARPRSRPARRCSPRRTSRTASPCRSRSDAAPTSCSRSRRLDDRSRHPRRRHARRRKQEDASQRRDRRRARR